MPDLAEGSDEFDEQRFRALLDLAGPRVARELTSRLSEDLSLVAAALSGAKPATDPQLLLAQSHVLLSIAGTIGASRLYLLSLRLNDIAKATETGPVVDILFEIKILLERLIARIRSTHTALAGEL